MKVKKMKRYFAAIMMLPLLVDPAFTKDVKSKEPPLYNCKKAADGSTKLSFYVGETLDEAKYCMKKPDRVYHHNYGLGKETIVWVYNFQYLFFDDEILTHYDVRE